MSCRQEVGPFCEAHPHEKQQTGPLNTLNRKWMSFTDSPHEIKTTDGHCDWAWRSVIDELSMIDWSALILTDWSTNSELCWFLFSSAFILKKKTLWEQEVVLDGRTDRSGGLPVRTDALSIILRLTVDASETSAAERADWLCNMTPAVSHLWLRLPAEGVACHCDALFPPSVRQLLNLFIDRSVSWSVIKRTAHQKSLWINLSWMFVNNNQNRPSLWCVQVSPTFYGHKTKHWLKDHLGSCLIIDRLI